MVIATREPDTRAMVQQPADTGPTGAAEIVAILARCGLVPPGATPRLTPLTGGVASDIWKVELGERTIVVKRALPKLRVAADWRAPVSRNASEADWLRIARRVVPGAVPEVLMQDTTSGLFAMTYYSPDKFPVWKGELHAGRVDVAFSAQVGRTIARIHAATAGDAEIARHFDNDATFHAIRLEPYLEVTAARHPEIADRLFALSHLTLARHQALVHGDVSPKNILVGPDGPILLDAECAWYGDPAFDLAFCLNHLLLKCLWTPESAADFLLAFDALQAAYFATMTGDAKLEARTAALLPALFLARVDGKSPVEYITAEEDRNRVRQFAVPLVRTPVGSLQTIRSAWAQGLGLPA
jgi:aminoglycoside phosphotransferase (APT) family kinase protein